MSDERNNRPSASAVEQMSLCPGSWMAQQNLPETPSDDSKQGDLIHAALAGDSTAFDKMTSDQLSIYDELTEKSARLEQIVFPDGSFENGYEIRLWNLSREFSAKADRVSIKREHGTALIRDFKTGRNEVAESSGNLQLRTQAVCAAAELKCHTIYVAIVQIGRRPTLCKYELVDLTRAELEILGIINEAEKDDAKRIPGEKQCRYCRARFQCPERLHSLSAVTPMLPVIQARGLPALPAHDLAMYLDKLPAIKRICDDLTDEAKRRIQAGEDVPGYTLKHGKPREAITNLPTVHARFLETAFKHFNEQNLTLEQRAATEAIFIGRFTSACGLTKTNAKELITEATGKKGKEADRLLSDLISGCTAEGKTPEPQLERI